MESESLIFINSGLIFRVLDEYEPDNLLLRQAYTEVFNQELDEVRMKEAFNRINECDIVITRAKSFTPLSFPIKVDSLRNSMSNEDLAKRIERMQEQAYKLQSK